MTVITDVPQSGIYFQNGAIVQLVVQILDINTGLPVQLQTATALTISLLYPDTLTSQVFPATLYTDGSDGMIVYTTVNNGTQIDLSQVGLYHMQGSAVQGGVQLPPSYETDFYVLPNVFGGNGMIQYTPSAIILFDNAGTRWVGIVPPSGGSLVWTAQQTGPSSFLQFNQLVMKDDSGVYWTQSISTLGVVTATAGGTFPDAVNSFLMSDINGKTWIITVTEAGTMVAS